MQAKRWSMKARTWIINSTLQWKQVSGYLINILFEIMLVSWCSKIVLSCHQFDAEPTVPLFWSGDSSQQWLLSLVNCDGLNLWVDSAEDSSVVLPCLYKEFWVSLCCLCLQQQRAICAALVVSVTCIFYEAFFTKTSVDSWDLHAY